MAAAPLPPTVPSAVTEEPLSEGSRILNTFIAPSKTFADIRRNAWWWAPYLLIAVVWIGFVYVVEQKVGFRKISENQIEMVPKAAEQFEKMAPEERERQFEQRAKGSLWFAYGKVALRALWFLVVASILFGTVKLAAGAEISFKQTLAVVVYSTLPFVLQLILAMIALLAGVSPDGFNPDIPLASNAAYFVDPRNSLVVYSLLSAFDLFAIWTLVLAAIGLSTISKVKRSTAMMIVFGWFALVVLIGVGIAAAFS